MTDLSQATSSGGTLYVFALPDSVTGKAAP